MVKIVEENNNAQAATTATAGDAALGKMKSTAAEKPTDYSGVFDRAFDWSSSSSMAGDFVRALDEAAEKNDKLRLFKYGVVEGIAPEMGSAAFVAGDYNGSWLYGLLFFEKGQSMRFQELPNHQETYYTLVDLIDKSVLAKVEASIGTGEAVHYMLTNTVPDISDHRMSAEWAQSLMGQMLLGIFGRAPGWLGGMVLSKADRFQINVATPDSGIAMDDNGHPSRADFALYVEHTPSNQNQDEPTLLDSSAATEFPPVRAAGYVNLRFTGLKAPGPNGVQDLKQLQGEVVVSLIDSQARGSRAPYERQIVTLAGFADMAQNGGWRDQFINTLNTTDRKFSALASYLSWGNDGVPDLSKLDKNRDHIDQALKLFAPSSAALVVNHRAGNGVGGLSNLLSEIAVGNLNSLGQLMNILDAMFAKGSTESFRKYFAKALGDGVNPVAELLPRHVVAAAVPGIAGIYSGAGSKRSVQDGDLIAVCSFLGDKQTDVMRYVHAQSYQNRELEQKAQRIYLAKLYSGMYGNRQLRLTGESLDMAINPILARCILDKVREKAGWQINGVNAYNEMETSLFYNNGGQSLILTGNGTTGGLSDFGLGVSLSDYNL
ncbi:hypothetical protein BIZ78_gp248 [Erwinia phage vB_EamM_Caitlin]|uniref:hypothetical protein n=1 Tax=Erwinia phage vB_EamM_Caitlin TaxID=1883379 RepID=UPI00081D199C|nr:hypothetical protein BIZ78_gp248 [Erwinia phage vB_EamM_Caitlin]ANZ48327.1 hypothetical protein CAITLIN_32 [Erwinia phage vB_EamM_Caitlin]